jgi:hypothetical protein
MFVPDRQQKTIFLRRPIKKWQIISGAIIDVRKAGERRKKR